MKALLILLLSVPAYAQLFGFGVRGGVPLTDFANTVESQNFTFNTHTGRYVIGPTAELRLPFGLGVEVDALYRHMSYTGSGVAGSIISTGLNSGMWEFPVLGKYRFPGKIARPFVDAGVSFNRLVGLTQSVSATVSSGTPVIAHDSSATGFVIGGGLDLHFVLHFTPEIRYTRWGSQQFVDPTGLLHSNQNQAEVLVGITF
jgi:opacity protein-like surface antigen